MKRTFRLNRSFSINSDSDFRNYAHNLMKNAHGDDYSEEETDKVVDDLLKDNPGADYGELIGRLTSGFGQKNFGLSFQSLDRISDKINKELLKLSSEDYLIIFERILLDAIDNSKWNSIDSRIKSLLEDYSIYMNTATRGLRHNNID